MKFRGDPLIYSPDTHELSTFEGNLAENIKKLSSIPPEIIRKPMVF